MQRCQLVILSPRHHKEEKTELSSDEVLYSSHDKKAVVPFKHLLMLQSLSSKQAYITTWVLKRMPA
jgi:hypothetical protein